VLILTDSPDRARRLTDAFGGARFWVSVSSVSEGLEASIELRPDLLVVTGNGADVICHAMRADERTLTIPILAVGAPFGDDRLADAVVESDAPVDRVLAAADELLALRDAGSQPVRVRLVDDTRVSPDKHRPCPSCAAPLRWVERSRLYGVEYDYYAWCPNGCGLYCYDLGLGAWAKLA